MPFNSSALSEKTVKSFVDRLLRRYKNHPDSGLHSIKRAVAQEDVAAMLGYASWHALLGQLNASSSSNPPDHWMVTELMKQMAPDTGVYRSDNNSNWIEAQTLRQHIMLYGSEQTRRQWYTELVRGNPSKAVLFVQGPLSYPLHWNGSTLSHNAVVSEAFYACRSAASIVDFLVQQMDDIGGDNAMWKSRAIAMALAVVQALVHLRDNHDLAFNSQTLAEYIELDTISHLSYSTQLPAHITQALKAYLRSLPGYRNNVPRQSEATLDEHRYLQMQFGRILATIDHHEVKVDNTRLRIVVGSTPTQTAALTLINAWSAHHTNGLVVLDGLEHTSVLYHGLLQAFTTLHHNGVGVIVGVASSADLPDDDNARKRLHSRIGRRLELEQL